MWRSVLAWTVLAGCASDAEDGRPGDASVDAATSETGSLPTTATGIPWGSPPPTLHVQEATQGQPNTLEVRGVVDGIEAVFYRSKGPEGEGPCDASGCLGIVAAEEIGAGVASEGRASMTWEVPRDFPTGAYFYQARLYNPATGARGFSTVASTHVSLPPGAGRVGFQDVSQVARLGNHLTTGNTHTGGAVWGDFDGDWWPDLAVLNGGGLNRALYLNEGNGTFASFHERIAKGDIGLEDAGAVAADLDNDGDVDLLVAVDNPATLDFNIPQPYAGGPNQLFRNQGDGTFVEEGLASGVVDPRGWRTSTVTLADFDRDGWLDIWFGNWAMSQIPGGDNFGRLLHNAGDGTFVEVPGGPDGYGRDALHAMAFDYDRDGWPDLYVGNVAGQFALPDYDPRDVLYHNAGGSLSDVTAEHTGFGDDAWAVMGGDVADVENDGDWDLYLTNLFFLPQTPPRGNPLYLGDGTGHFTENQCFAAEICTGHETWPAVFADFDRDRYVDLYVGTSMSEDPDLLFVNDGDGTFTSHRQEAFVNDTPRGGSQADFDGDGAVDLFAWMMYQSSRLYRNTAADGRHWLELKLIGAQSNRDAVGAVVEVTAGGVTQLRWVSGGDSAHSQRDHTVHVGLGDATEAQVVVRWPNGDVTGLGTVSADRFVAVQEDRGLLLDELVDATAAWDGATLTVTAHTTYHGRSAVRVDGFGPIPWSRADGAYVASFPAASDPGQLVLRVGGALVYAVDVTP